MNIYFAGSIRGGRENQGIYFDIIELLRPYGKVLTEHVANPALTEEGDRLDDSEIYERDIKWIKKADVLIADVSMPSLGVGYEIAYAESLGTKILCLYKEGSPKKISGMINGNKNFTIEKYKDVSNLSSVFKEFFK